MSMSRIRFFDTYLFLLLFVANFICYYLFKTTSVPLCTPIGDCFKYTAMYYAFQQHIFPAIDFPFNMRILTPWLASLLPGHDANAAFLIVTVISINFFALVFFELGKALKISVSLVFVAVIWFLLHTSGLSLYFSAVVNTDPLDYFFAALILLVVVRERYFLLPFIAVFATFSKESAVAIFFMIVIARVFAIWKNIDSNKKPFLYSLMALIVAIVCKQISGKIFFHPIGQAAEWSVMHYWLVDRLSHPIQLLNWVTALMVSLGVFPLLSLYRKREIFRQDHLLLFALLTVTYFLFGIVAGSDTSRIIFTGSVYIFTFLFYMVDPQKISGKDLAIVVVFSLPVLLLNRTGIPIFPEYANSLTLDVSWLLYFLFAYTLGAELLRNLSV